MAQLCQAWENEALAITQKTAMREVRLRIGVVLAADGGALAVMKRPYQFGVGGPLGKGRQWMNWIHRDDLVNLIVNALQDTQYSGVYTRSKMKPGFQIVAGAYSSYVTRAIWKGIRSRFHFGMGIQRGESWERKQSDFFNCFGRSFKATQSL